MLSFFVHFPTFFPKYVYNLPIFFIRRFFSWFPLNQKQKYSIILDKYANMQEGDFIMDLVTVRQIYKNREEYLDKEVTVGGWVRSLRDSKAFGFIVLSDGTYFEPMQVV